MRLDERHELKAETIHAVVPEGTFLVARARTAATRTRGSGVSMRRCLSRRFRRSAVPSRVQRSHETMTSGNSGARNEFRQQAVLRT